VFSPTYSARSGAAVAAKELLAIAKAHPLDTRRALVAEMIRGDLAALDDDRAAMYTHYAIALADADKALRPDDDRVAEIRFRIGLAYVQDGAAKDADDLFAQAFAIWQRTNSPHAADAAVARASLVDCAAALPVLDRLIPAIEDRLDRGRARYNQAVCVDTTGDRTKARAVVGKLAGDAPAYSPDLAMLADDWLVTHAAAAGDDVHWASSVRSVSSEFGVDTSGERPARSTAAGGAESIDKSSAKQALGAPNVYPHAGDVSQAWASKDADAQTEYIELGFEPVRTSAIRIYETFNPGAIATVEIITASGAHTKVAETASPVPAPPQARVVAIDVPCTSEPVVAVRITLASSRVPGWNEIDAVGLVPCH
jgi:tetratricopeptide (TPR) repeat protein